MGKLQVVEGGTGTLVKLAPAETATKNWIAQVRGGAELRSFTRVAMRASHEQGRATQTTNLLVLPYGGHQS